MVRTATMMMPLLAALGACGGQAQSLDDGGASVGSDATAAEEPTVHTSFLTILHGGSDACMPQTLPVDASGEVPCTIFVLPGAATCDASRGLSAVDPGVAASVRAAGQAPASESVCQLAQLPATVWVNGSCVGSGSAGWCYLTAPAAGASCAQAIRFSPSGTPAAGDEVLLGCQ